MTKDTSRSSDEQALDPRVRTVLAAASAPVETAGPLPGEEEALAAFRAAPQCTEPTSMLSRLVSAKVAVASAIGTGVLLIGGVGAAAAGVLPGPAQETVSAWLETVGISVPAGEGPGGNGEPRGSEQTPGQEADDNADLRGSEETPVEDAELPPAADHGKADPGRADRGKADHGKEVSETAKNSTAEGADKGKEIAGVASDGRVEAGDHGSAQTPQDGKPGPQGRP